MLRPSKGQLMYAHTQTFFYSKVLYAAFMGLHCVWLYNAHNPGIAMALNFSCIIIIIIICVSLYLCMKLCLCACACINVHILLPLYATNNLVIDKKIFWKKKYLLECNYVKVMNSKNGIFTKTWRKFRSSFNFLPWWQSMNLLYFEFWNLKKMKRKLKIVPHVAPRSLPPSYRDWRIIH